MLIADVNRPALQLTGFFEHFDEERVQMIGYVEQAYLSNMDQRANGSRSIEKLLFQQYSLSDFLQGIWSRSRS